MKSRELLCALLFGSVVLVGCGDTDTQEPIKPTTTSTPPAAKTLDENSAIAVEPVE